MTLIEIMVVVAIIGLGAGGAVMGLRSVGKATLKGSAAQMASAIRYCYDRAITTNSYYRMVIDLGSNSYSIEKSDERMLLAREKEKAPGKGIAFDRDALEKERDVKETEDEQRMRARGQGLGIALEPPPRPKRAKFQSFTDATAKKVVLKKVRLFDVYTPRQRESYKQGKAYLYFFPDGHTERAIIHLADGEDFYTLLVSPLTGKVEVRKGRIEAERDFDTKGQEGAR